MAEEKGKPLTRKDVDERIKKNEGATKSLDLSGGTFEDGIDLSGLPLREITLCDTRLIGANFNGSDLDGAVMQRAMLQHATFNPLEGTAATLTKVDLRGAYLKNAEFREADLSGAQFQEDPEQLLRASLEETDFRNTNLLGTNFKECYFYRTKLEGACIEGSNIDEARLGDADWGNYRIGEENKNKFDIAEHRYRHLKMWYTQSGYSDIAAKFYYREKEASRKALNWRSKLWYHRLVLEASYRFFGYGERWRNILLWIAVVVFGFAAAYYLWGSFSSSSFSDTLYYSAASFTALGYGQWAPQPTGWAKVMGAAEAFIGVSMMALLLVTFVRKWTR